LSISGPQPGGHVLGSTLSLNIKSGPFTLIPEIRYDDINKSYTIFSDSDGNPTSGATQFVLAAVYAF
jgi:hypothetical protein